MSKPISLPPAQRVSVQDHGSLIRPAAHASRLGVSAALAAAVLSSLGAPSSVEAGPRDRPRTPVADRVLYGDLDLNTVAGARTMYLRINGAASRACALPNTPVLETAPAEVRRCRGQALARAVRKLDAPLVTAEYGRLYPQSPTVSAQR